ncbi:MAG TPA: sugar phosphate nucleotidyltransferase [Gemmatimonadaceae bacterium]|nr:sugar phosphate nucleotidyltransferase [Gemmatimonadaceae bacterium]
MSRWAVVLAGGVGSRFWPLSTPRRPKQLLSLVGARPMLEESLHRLRPLVDSAHTLILTNASLAEPVRALDPSLPADNVIAEPRPAGTTAALTWAAREIERREGPDAIMMSIHADWAIANDAAFVETLREAERQALAHRALVTVGIVPTRPDTGFGYIQPGDVLAGGGARRVSRFLEKPDQARAESMIAAGCLWNSGIFVWRVGDFLEEVRKHAHEVAPALDEAGEDIDAFFARARSIAVDHAVLERSSRVIVIPGDFGWDDVGTWAALARVRTRDDAGNAVHGAVHLQDAHDNVVHADNGDVVLYGVHDLVVVTRDGMTLVTTRERAADLKTLLDALPADVRDGQ